MSVRVQTAMIVDDDQDMAQLLAVILEKRKIHVMSVHSLAEAEMYLSYLKPTMVFLDNSFPDGLGINFIKQIRLADEGIKIIMITADSAQWIEQKAFSEGTDYFLRKPLTMSSLDHWRRGITTRCYNCLCRNTGFY